MTSTGCLTFTTTVGVIHRVHHHAANVGPNTHPALATGFTDTYQAVIPVAHDPYRGAAVLMNFPKLTAGQLD